MPSVGEYLPLSGYQILTSIWPCIDNHKHSCKAMDFLLHLLKKRSLSQLHVCNTYPILLWARGSHSKPLLLATSPTTIVSMKGTFIFCSPPPNSFPVTSEPPKFLPTSAYGGILCCNHLTTDFPNGPWHSDAFPDVNVDSNQL